MEIAHRDSGEPYAILHGKGETLFKSRGAKSLLVSISHTEQYAAVVAVLEG